MMKPEKKKAEVSAVAGTLGNGIGSGSQEVGLSMKINRIGRRCTTSDGRGMMSVPGGFAGCRLGGLQNERRMSATPGFTARGVFFWRGIRSIGQFASIASVQTLTGWPCGKPSGLLFPFVQSANPHGSALPLAGVWQFLNRYERSIVMMLKPAPDARIASAEALPGALSTNPSINEPVRSEAIAEDIRAILSACSRATSTISGNVREAVRMQVLGFLHEVASAGQKGVCHE